MGNEDTGDSYERRIHRAGLKEDTVLLNGRDNFWNGAKLAEFIDTIRCQDCLVIHFFLADTYPAQLVTNYSDILFGVLHNGIPYFFYDTIKRCFLKIQYSL
jgi:hypothetical protein